jgi:hypothetical protein
MISSIITALIEKNAFEKDTIITAKYQSLDLFGRSFDKVGDFRIHKIVKNQEKIIFELISLQDVTTVIIKREPEHIEAVDGMKIERFADVYGLDSSGLSKKTGKKRGRKSKNI